MVNIQPLNLPTSHAITLTTLILGSAVVALSTSCCVFRTQADIPDIRHATAEEVKELHAAEREHGLMTLPTSTVTIHQNLENLPLILVLSPQTRAWAPIVEDAVNEWNATLRFEAFVYGGVLDRNLEAKTLASIVPVVIDSHLTDKAYTNLSYDEATGEIDSAYLLLPVGVFHKRAAQIIVMHELGHLLGLAHDAEPKSLMTPALSELNIAITDHDLALLRKTYGALLVPTK